MSTDLPFASIPTAVLFNKALSREARLLYVAVWWWDFDDATPTQNQMADEIGCSVMNVWRCIKELEEAGLVRQTRGGYGKPNLVKPTAGPFPKRRGQSLLKEGTEPSQRRDRAFSEKGRVVTTQRESKAQQPARLPADAGGDHDTRRTVLDYLQHHTGVYADRADAMVHRDAPAVLEQLQREGVVVLEEQAFGPYFRLTKEE